MQMNGTPGENCERPSILGILLKFSETGISLDD
jgi:hypothetical protein